MPYFPPPSAGGAGTPGGSDTQLQYNNAGAFGGAKVIYEDATYSGALRMADSAAATSPSTLQIRGGDSSGSGTGAVLAVLLATAGTGYQANDVLTLDDGDTNAEVTVNSVGGSGEILTYTVTTAGTGYSSYYLPLASGEYILDDPIEATGGNGSGATFLTYVAGASQGSVVIEPGGAAEELSIGGFLVLREFGRIYDATISTDYLRGALIQFGGSAQIDSAGDVLEGNTLSIDGLSANVAADSAYSGGFSLPNVSITGGDIDGGVEARGGTLLVGGAAADGAGSTTGGSATLQGGSGTIAGAVNLSQYDRVITLTAPNNGNNALLDYDAIDTSSKTFSLPNTTGTIDVTASSKRFKKNIKALASDALEMVEQLQPREFTYKKDYGGREAVGLIAEEVEKIDPRLVMHDKDGEPTGVYYTELTAVLIKAVQQLNAEVTELKRRLGE